MDSYSKGLLTVVKQLFNGRDKDEPPERPEEVKLFEKMKDFFLTTIREIMVPRTKMITIERKSSIEDAIRLINSSGLSRIPVQEDRRDNIVGVLYAKDLFKYFDAERNETLVEEVMRKPYFASYNQPIHTLLTNLKKKHVYLAIVVDEYGGVDGLITIEDILEELVGDIHDEYDQANEPSYSKMDENIFMDANYLLQDFNELYHTTFKKEGVETIGGYLCHRLGKIPEKNDAFDLEGIHFVITDADERRLSKLKITLPEKGVPKESLRE